jgi:hypothetical protein
MNRYDRNWSSVPPETLRRSEQNRIAERSTGRAHPIEVTTMMMPFLPVRALFCVQLTRTALFMIGAACICGVHTESSPFFCIYTACFLKDE